MFNITFSRSDDLESKKTESIYSEKIKNVFEIYKSTDSMFFSFAEIIIKNIPFFLLEILSSEDLDKFIRYLFNLMLERKKKKVYQTITNPGQMDFFIGNFSVITMNADDRPFLVDSIVSYFYEININNYFIMHPIFNVRRNHKWEITGINSPGLGTKNESFVVIFIENIETERLNTVSKELLNIYDEIFLTVDDYPEMNSLINNLVLNYKNKNPDVSDFLSWISNNNFIIQGIRILNNIDLEKETYNMEQYGVYKLNRTLNLVPNMIKALKNGNIKYVDGYNIVFDKAIYTSKVKKRTNYDRIILIDKNKNSYTLVSIIGILSRDGNKTSPFNISIIRQKINEIVDYFNFVHGSHDHKWLIDILGDFPKTEIISFDKKTIISVLKIIFSTHGKNNLLFFMKDFKPMKNFYTFMAFPESKFSNETLDEIKKVFEKILNAKTMDISVRQDEHGYVFVHFHFYLKDIIILDNLQTDFLSAHLRELLKDWTDDFYEKLELKFSGSEIDRLFEEFKNSFSETYKTKCTPEEAVEDIVILKKLDDMDASLYADSSKVAIKLYSKKRILLTDIMPVIDNMGIQVNEEFTYKIETNDKKFYINSIYLANVPDFILFKQQYSEVLPELIMKVVTGKVENDNLNRLLIKNNLNFRQIDLLRAVRNYTEQINPYFNRVTINETILSHSEVAKLLVTYFETKFIPSLKRRDLQSILNEIYELIEKVTSLQEDNILRHFTKIFQNMLRTNFFLQKDYISFKIDSKKMDILPDPKPLYEIYVHSSEMEGIHLRGGKVARGGLRFSDRHDDFRTEILGLMKTQMVKNTVIVPVGSKGGFIVKNKRNDKEHVVKQYKTLIRGLLDITDNYSGNKVVHPPKVVIYDEEDPYLVVAADKGTATFSDIANSVSNEYGFWLGDAFASGGSAGYDHKKVGITAKGAWESVKRHFRELGKDIQKEPFTVVGIGDMSGDVFGNGMLLSKQIKLLGSFNHIHIFIDPDPKPETSYYERLRLFKLPRSTWKDYNQELISKGGGVFERSAKKIHLSDEIKAIFDINENDISGEELIKYMLKSNAELLWNGGIGTYVKDDDETNEQVGDKSNDNVRISASELRVKVIGEGGNLGMTQKARIKFSMNGGLINTDALDNSAGVDMSDHEVNIKILLDVLLKNKTITDMKSRNNLISKLTEEVSELVLRDNYLQSMAISCGKLDAKTNIVSYIDAAEFLKEAGILNFEIEQINFIKESRDISRPELCVLLAYTKIMLFESVVDELNSKNELLEKCYTTYYPKSMIKEYKKYFDEHKLKREITATVAVNKAVNQVGIPTFVEIYKTTGQSFARILETYLFADELLSAQELRNKVEKLDGKIGSQMQYFMLLEIEKTLKNAVKWLVRQSNKELLSQNLDKFNQIKDYITSNIYSLYDGEYKSFSEKLKTGGCPLALGREVSNIKFIKSAFDILEIVTNQNIEINRAIKDYLWIKKHFQIGFVVDGIKNTPIKTNWDKVNRDNLLTKIRILHRQLAEKYCNYGNDFILKIEKEESIFFMNYRKFIESIVSKELDTLVPFNVMVDAFFNVVGSK